MFDALSKPATCRSFSLTPPAGGYTTTLPTTMTTTSARYTWVAEPNGKILVGRALVTYLPDSDEYVCSVCIDARVRHYFAKTLAEAIALARTKTEEAYGPIRNERPLFETKELRVARWNGGAHLTSGSEAVVLDEDEAVALSRCNPAQARAYAGKHLLGRDGRLSDRQRELLTAWLNQGNWDRVPFDALFTTSFPGLDYLAD